MLGQLKKKAAPFPFVGNAGEGAGFSDERAARKPVPRSRGQAKTPTSTGNRPAIGDSNAISAKKRFLAEKQIQSV